MSSMPFASEALISRLPNAARAPGNPRLCIARCAHPFQSDAIQMASSTKANPLDDGIVDTLGSLGATSGVHISASRQDNAKGRPSRRPGEYGGETPPRACADELTSPL